MRLTTVGTGTAAPSPGRVQSGHLVDVGDVHLLMDCGSGVATRLADLAIRWQDITHLAITHFHADHVVAFAKGGTTVTSNGQALCAACNLRKGAR